MAVANYGGTSASATGSATPSSHLKARVDTEVQEVEDVPADGEVVGAPVEKVRPFTFVRDLSI